MGQQKNLKPQIDPSQVPTTLIETLIQSSKLVNLGIISAGIIHDLGTPVSLRTILISQLKNHIAAEDKTGMDLLAHLEKSNHHSGSMIQFWKDYLKGGTGKYDKTCQLNNIVAESIDLIQKFTKMNDIIIESSFDQQLPLFKGNALQLQSAVQNILMNSVEAFKKYTPKTDKLIQISSHWILGKNEKLIALTIKDNGKGMQKETVEKIFNPFFSHGKASGTGLGLYLANKIIDAHHGSMQINSQEKIGTEVRFSIPFTRT